MMRSGNADMPGLWTIGHGNRDWQTFSELLRKAGIQLLVDIRRRPYSNRFPWFNRDDLLQQLSVIGIAYEWQERLGGHRSAQLDSPHQALTDAYRGFADHMATPDFQQAMTQVLAWAEHKRVALLCAERDPGHCHRSLIADWLVLQGCPVHHLLEAGQQRPHQPHPAVRVRAGRIIYDGGTQLELLAPLA